MEGGRHPNHANGDGRTYSRVIILVGKNSLFLTQKVWEPNGLLSDIS